MWITCQLWHPSTLKRTEWSACFWLSYDENSDAILLLCDMMLAVSPKLEWIWRWRFERKCYHCYAVQLCFTTHPLNISSSNCTSIFYNPALLLWLYDASYISRTRMNFEMMWKEEILSLLCWTTLLYKSPAENPILKQYITIKKRKFSPYNCMEK